ncbi:MAG: ABC transporter substrate-binding protein [Clostridia bacterium]|jgi:branched-chain amino acid transport system substrate-binding protein|nr:ABC transporter substrate-binding protein [Clostridia bacterium]
MKFSKWLVALVLVLFAAGALVGCGGSQPAEQEGQQQQGAEESKEPIKIGINYELSGEVATYGSNTKNAIVMAFEEINASGGVLDGRLIDPIVLDNKSDNAEATSVGTRLITKDKVAVHLGPATTGATLAVVPVATQYKVPLLTTSATHPDVTVDPQSGAVRDYVFRVCFIDPPQGIVGAAFAYNDLGARKAAIYYDNTNDYSKGLYRVFKEEFTKLGGTIVAEEGYVKEDQEFRPTLTKFRDAGVDVVYLPGYYQKAALIISQAREIGLDVPFVGADGFDSPDLVAIAGAENLKNVFFTNHYSSQDPSEKVQSFVQAYKAKYGDMPDSFAALGYDAAYLVADAINRAGSADPEAIRNALAETKNFEAVTGTMSFDENHNPVKEIAIIEMVDGEQTLRTKIAP